MFCCGLSRWLLWGWFFWWLDWWIGYLICWDCFIFCFFVELSGILICFLLFVFDLVIGWMNYCSLWIFWIVCLCWIFIVLEFCLRLICFGFRNVLCFLVVVFWCVEMIFVFGSRYWCIGLNVGNLSFFGGSCLICLSWLFVICGFDD